jgi:preprotein translocase subunit SecA
VEPFDVLECKFMGLFSKLFKDTGEAVLDTLEPLVSQINSLEEGVLGLSDDELKAKTGEFKERLKNGESEDDILPEAFAVVREAAKRVLGQRHFDVQLLGGIILHKGKISEMKTGEGKTLVATLPAYLNALSGKGVHVVTVNDYLARRDAVWMGQIYNFLGLSVGILNGDRQSFLYDPTHKEGSKEDEERDEVGSFKVEDEFLRPATRREAYYADITYGVNNEFGFDYLRDNMAYKENQLVGRGYNYAIVDEIDSILIDEARTPLIISGATSEGADLYKTFADISAKLKRDEDYEVDEKLRAITLTDSGIEKAEKALGVENIYTEGGVKFVHHLETAVRAKAVFEKDKDYVVKDGEVIIVDEFTGRLMSGRRWSEGLHQAVEAKEGVPIQKESRTMATITFQNFFRFYSKLSGMTGTAQSSSEEFYKVYGLDTVVVPTNQPIARLDENDLIFQSEIGKFKAIAKKIKELNEAGQPVLVGTVSVEKNELLGQFLKGEGIKHEILNAKNHDREGEIIAQAGRKGAVTIATNMAGRGVDIKLGGSPGSTEEYEEIKSSGGLFVLGTERHEARRIDNQLRGRAGRQGDPGETQFFVSLEDSLLRVFGSERIKTMMGRFGIPEDEPVENKLITRSLEQAQEKIEGFNFDARKKVLEYDTVMNTQREAIYARRRNIVTADKDGIEKEIFALDGAATNIEEVVKQKEEALGGDIFVESARALMLQVIDMLWVEHLEAMAYMRDSVRLRAYGQRDPLVEYKREGLILFHDMEERINEEIIKLLPAIGEGAFRREEAKLKEVHANVSVLGNADQVKEKETIVRNEEKIGRNDMVVIEKDGETKEIKYKKAEPLIENEGWVIRK